MCFMSVCAYHDSQQAGGGVRYEVLPTAGPVFVSVVHVAHWHREAAGVCARAPAQPAACRMSNCHTRCFGAVSFPSRLRRQAADALLQQVSARLRGPARGQRRTGPGRRHLIAGGASSSGGGVPQGPDEGSLDVACAGELLARLLQEACGRLRSLREVSDAPDLADDAFLLAGRSLHYAPALVLQPPALLPTLLDSAAAGVLVQHRCAYVPETAVDCTHSSSQTCRGTYIATHLGSPNPNPNPKPFT